MDVTGVAMATPPKETVTLAVSLFHIQNGIWSSFSTVLAHWFVCPPMHEEKDL